jgi:hypothetical protein
MVAPSSPGSRPGPSGKPTWGLVPLCGQMSRLWLGVGAGHLCPSGEYAVSRQPEVILPTGGSPSPSTTLADSSPINRSATSSTGTPANDATPHGRDGPGKDSEVDRVQIEGQLIPVLPAAVADAAPNQVDDALVRTDRPQRWTFGIPAEARQPRRVWPSAQRSHRLTAATRRPTARRHVHHALRRHHRERLPAEQ